ncbi:FAD-binding protein [Adhaeribacter aquaticus]|uniref:FAD-binding protein n=1 Tax=Adhaeribacter aquaticus TaxID=299567 RepID=UPI000412A1E1|nr:FAD-binding protein [Adhaeribacter aquaticus]
MPIKLKKYLAPTQQTGDPVTPFKDAQTGQQLVNWAGNITYSTNKILFPETTEEVQEALRSNPKLKVLGSRHCFNRIADSEHVFISTRDLNKIVELDKEAHKVTVEAGIKYGELAPFLHQNGYSLPNMASLPHISVAGSVITATHGSGVKNGNLATSVSAVEMVLADGSIKSFSKEKDQDLFDGIVVNLGALGIITQLTLDLQPAFTMQQFVYQNLPLNLLETHFTEIVSAGYSVSLFTDWSSNFINEVWIKCREQESKNFESKEAFFEATAATQHLHPIANISAENCTEQLGTPGPWYDRLPHFKMGFMPSSGVELQSEYFVPEKDAVPAIKAIAQLGSQINPHLLISEIRTIAEDDLWLSPCYKRNCVAIHFTWKQDWPAVSKLLPVIEATLAPFNARPHWGKLFTMAPEALATQYEKLPDFKALIAKFDPEGIFKNEFLARNILGKI